MQNAPLLNVVVRLARLLIVEQLREPVGIFWSIIAPPVLFTLMHTNSATAATLAWYVQAAGWYLSYIAVTVSLFSFALYFVGRRESGFVRSFIVGAEAKRIFIAAQALASTGLAICGYLVFIALTAGVAGVPLLPAAASLFPPFMVALAFCMSATLLIAALPITFQNAGAGISIFSAVLLILSISQNYSGTNALLHIANTVNPLHLWASMISSGGTFTLAHIVLAALSATLGAIGYRCFRLNPVWNRQ